MEDIVSGKILFERAAALVPVLKERAALTEQLRQIPADSVRDLRARGLIRAANPVRFGGASVEIDAAFDMSSELARGCGSTGWCYAIWTAHNWWLGHFPGKAQEEYFSSGPDTLMAAGLNPSNASAERVPGGYRVRGRWAFSSGCDAASWIMVACNVDANQRRWLLVPREECEIVDTWFAAGLRGSGSKEIGVGDVFVPDHRAMDPNRAGDGDLTGWDLHRRASYGVPLKVMLEWALAAPAIGMAQGVLDEFVELASRRGASGRPPVAIELRVARAAAEIETARLLHRARVREILDRSGEPGFFTPLERARCVRDAAFSVRLCVQAVDSLYEASGVRAVMDSSPLQRLYRDTHAASHHAALNWDVAAEQYGRCALACQG